MAGRYLSPRRRVADTSDLLGERQIPPLNLCIWCCCHCSELRNRRAQQACRIIALEPRVLSIRRLPTADCRLPTIEQYEPSPLPVRARASIATSSRDLGPKIAAAVFVANVVSQATPTTPTKQPEEACGVTYTPLDGLLWFAWRQP